MQTPDPSDSMIVKHDLSLQRRRFHSSRLQWQHALHNSSQSLALHKVILDLCAAAQELIEIYFMKLQAHSSSADVASRGRFELCGTIE